MAAQAHFDHGSQGSRPFAKMQWTLLLQNRFAAGEYVLLAERPPRDDAADTQQQQQEGTDEVAEFVAQASGHADVAHLSFGAALWPEDWQLTTAPALLPAHLAEAT